MCSPDHPLHRSSRMTRAYPHGNCRLMPNGTPPTRRPFSTEGPLGCYIRAVKAAAGGGAYAARGAGQGPLRSQQSTAPR